MTHARDDDAFVIRSGTNVMLVVNQTSNVYSCSSCYEHHKNFGCKDVIDLNLPLNFAPLTPQRGRVNKIDIVDLSDSPTEVQKEVKSYPAVPNAPTEEQLNQHCKKIFAALDSRHVGNHVMKNLAPCVPSILGATKFRELEQSIAKMCQRSKAQCKKDMLCEALHHWTMRKKRPIPRHALQRIADQIKNCKQFKGIALFAMQSDWLIDDPNCSLSIEKR